MCGVVGITRLVLSDRRAVQCVVNRSGLGWPAAEGESPVDENSTAPVELSPSSSGPVKSAVNLPGPPGKPEYFLMTDSGLVP